MPSNTVHVCMHLHNSIHVNVSFYSIKTLFSCLFLVLFLLLVFTVEQLVGESGMVGELGHTVCSESRAVYRVFESIFVLMIFIGRDLMSVYSQLLQ